MKSMSTQEAQQAFNVLQQQAQAPWQLQEDSLQTQWKFQNFLQAMAFMNAVAEVAERMNHHPEWSNVYNRVNVRLTTHDAGGLTHLDFTLAQAMDSLAITASQS
jgi:4a-hydroxytetrahydrobiopterin dehydratase